MDNIVKISTWIMTSFYTVYLLLFVFKGSKYNISFLRVLLSNTNKVFKIVVIINTIILCILNILMANDYSLNFNFLIIDLVNKSSNHISTHILMSDTLYTSATILSFIFSIYIFLITIKTIIEFDSPEGFLNVLNKYLKKNPKELLSLEPNDKSIPYDKITKHIIDNPNLVLDDYQS